MPRIEVTKGVKEMTKFVVYNVDNEYEELGAFDTLKEAKAHIREVRRFDRENGNPFNDRYIVSKEEW